MNPETVAVHFARIKSLCSNHNIANGCYIFNLDESGFFIRGMALGGREKCVVEEEVRPNTRYLKFQGFIDHVSVMPVVSATVQVYTPVFILPGKKAKYRKRPDGRYETPQDFLPSPCYMYMREIAGMDSDIFYSWAQHFVLETAHLRRGGQSLLLVVDGHGSHIQYSTLQLLKDNNIFVAGLPAHTSHALQPLDVGVFGPMKEYFRQLLSTRTIATAQGCRFDVFTVCELLSKAYNKALRRCNIMGGFKKSGLWVQELRGPDFSRIRPNEFTSSSVTTRMGERFVSLRSTSQNSEMAISNVAEQRVRTSKELYVLYLRQSEKLCSDGTVEENGTIRVTNKKWC